MLTIINKRESTGLKYLNDSKAFAEYSNDMDDIYKTVEEYNPNEKLNPIVTELFITGRQLNISFVFITESYFTVPKNIRPNSTHYFVMKIPNKRELQQIAFNHSSDNGFHDFMNLYKKCSAKPYLFLVIDTTLASDNSSCFRKNIKTNHDN